MTCASSTRKGQLVYAGAIDGIASARVDDIKNATNYVRQGLNEALGGQPRLRLLRQIQSLNTHLGTAP